VRALVTGAAGFVGQWLVRDLLAAGHEVTGLTPVDPSTTATLLSTDEQAAIDWLMVTSGALTMFAAHSTWPLLTWSTIWPA